MDGARQSAMDPEPRALPWLLLVASLLIAAFSAKHYAGSWNDGSRLATVEALVDYHTLAIDRSIFAQPLDQDHPPRYAPYPRDEGAYQTGTKDKIFVQGQYYSDKPPILSVLLAGVYQVWQWAGGPTAHARPDLFAFVMTFVCAGLPYVVTVGCAFRMFRTLGLSWSLSLALTLSLALGTVALPYAQHVNNHAPLLGISAVLFLLLSPRPEASAASLGGRPLGARVPWRMALLGTLAGMAYAIDLAVGMVMLFCLVPLLLYRGPRPASLALFTLSLLPWLTAHHVINYAISGTIKPANTVVQYFDWPGTPFTTSNLTGVQPNSPMRMLTYGLELLVAKHGFLSHNLPLCLSLLGLWLLLRARPRELPELLFATSWCAGTWLLHAVASNNYGGVCCSIRWFVPLLVPGYFALAVLLRDFPEYRADFFILSAWGCLLGALMAWYGPWMRHMVPGYWAILALALLTWGYGRLVISGFPMRDGRCLIRALTTIAGRQSRIKS